MKIELKKNVVKKVFSAIQNIKPNELDGLFHKQHDEVFSLIDCLKCGNCCRSLGPRITDKDITRISKSLKTKPGELVETYLKIDEDGDYVFKQMPCPFLGEDNYCSIYEARPAACREYPHTDRRKMHQILSITAKNCSTCPAVVQIVDKIAHEKGIVRESICAGPLPLPQN